MARTPAKVKFDWLLFGWAVFLLLGGVLHCLGMWPYAEVTMEYVGQIYFLIIPTLFFVPAAFAVTGWKRKRSTSTWTPKPAVL
jgi:hypothetical protein